MPGLPTVQFGEARRSQKLGVQWLVLLQGLCMYVYSRGTCVGGYVCMSASRSVNSSTRVSVHARVLCMYITKYLCLSVCIYVPLQLRVYLVGQGSDLTTYMCMENYILAYVLAIPDRHTRTLPYLHTELMPQ